MWKCFYTKLSICVLIFAISVAQTVKMTSFALNTTNSRHVEDVWRGITTGCFIGNFLLSLIFVALLSQAMYLVYRALEGEPVPMSLPPPLVPPSKRKKPSVPPVMPLLPSPPSVKDSRSSHAASKTLPHPPKPSPAPVPTPAAAPVSTGPICPVRFILLQQTFKKWFQTG